MGKRLSISILAVVVIGVLFVFGTSYVSAFDRDFDVSHHAAGSDAVHQLIMNHESTVKYVDEEEQIDEELESDDEGDDEDQSAVDEEEEGDDMEDEGSEETTVEQE